MTQLLSTVYWCILLSLALCKFVAIGNGHRCCTATAFQVSSEHQQSRHRYKPCRRRTKKVLSTIEPHKYDQRLLMSSSSSSGSSSRTSSSSGSSSGTTTTTAAAAATAATTTTQSTTQTPVQRRAGEGGYSVLRQPVQWDVHSDPVFAIPESLKEEGDDRTKSSNTAVITNQNWLMSRSSSSSTNPTSSLFESSTTKQKRYNNAFSENEYSTRNKNDNNNDSNKETEEEDDELDLFQRSLNTLDFPRVLKALYKECSTVPGKRIVQDAFTSTDRTSDGSDNDNSRQVNKTGENDEEECVAQQPLMASTVTGSQNRYQALREMQWLLQGGNSSTTRIDDTITYKNRLGRKENLYYRPPPIRNNDNGFNLEGIIDLTTTQSRVLDSPDIVDILDMMNTFENVLLWNTGLQEITEYDFVQLPALVSSMTVNTTLQQLLQSAFDKEMRLNGETFPQIGQLRTLIRSLKSEVMSTLDTLIATSSVKSKLSLESGGALYSEVQGGRLVIPVDRKYASSIGIVHDSSRSGKTVYVEPNEIITSTNVLRQTEGELRTEEARIWRYLTEQIILNQDSLQMAAMVIGQLDVILARINLGTKFNGVIPIVRNEGTMILQNAKHPVLLLRGIENVVGSDITFGTDRNQGLILTGPNAGGKTVILKLLGLMALMARCGIPVPADKSARSQEQIDLDAAAIVDGNNIELYSYEPRVDFFNPVLADIGDIQSVGGDLSTFSGHMLVCREVLQRSGKNALILMDELGSGTDPNQGVAIAQALLEAVIQEGARVAITTHYMQLKQLAASDDRFSVAGMQFVNGRPTFKLLPGQIGESFALSVAERLGLPSAILNRANELLDSETRQMGELLREMEAQKTLIDQQVDALTLKQREMDDMKAAMEEEMIRLENQQLNIRRVEARKFAKMLEEKEAVLEDVLEKLKSDPSRRIVAKSWDDIKFIKRDALNEAENIASVIARKQAAAAVMEDVSADLVPIAEMREKPNLKEGDKVIICERGPMFAREATIIKALDSRVEVKVNNMNVSFKLTQLALIPTGKKIPTAKPPNVKNERALRQGSRSKAVEQALAFEGNTRTSSSSSTTRQYETSDASSSSSSSSGKVTMRTDLNTVDVLGCNLMDAQAKIRDKFSMCLMNGRSTMYILHGHGTGGVLKSKIRSWLKTEKLVKSHAAADRSDGGDAFTRVDLR
jgi:DNA mismatch repair protein MutS2